VWKQATLRAEGKWCRLNAAGFVGNGRSHQEIRAKCAEWIASRFDIWAERYVHVVWSEEELKAFDAWLFGYANATLNGIEQMKHSVITVSELRPFLTQRMEWWKAEARRYLSEQKAHAASSKPNALSVEYGERGGRPRQDDDRKKIREKKTARKSWKVIMEELNTESGNFRTIEAYQYLWRTDPLKESVRKRRKPLN
jgi:hypothetical protein